MVTRRQASALLLQLDGKVGMADQVARARAAMRAVSRTTPFARALLLVAAAAVAIGAVAAPLLLHAPFWLGVPASLFAIILAIVGWKARPLVSAVCAVPLYVALIQFELPRLAPLWVAPAAASALRAAWPSVPADGEGVFAVGYAEPSLMFLVGPRLRWLPTGALAARSWESLPHAAAFIAAPEVAGFVGEARRAGLTVAPVARIAGSDTARGKPVTLDLFVK
jgi:hypothetical protein